MSRTTGIGLIALIVLIAPWMVSQSVFAKPIHFESLKFELITQNIRCTDCHTDSAGPTLTTYGQHIADEGDDESIQARVRAFEGSPSLTASDEQKQQSSDRIDIDGDGIANWIEILASTSPSAGNDRNDTHSRIERVITCKLCHESVAAFPQPGRERAPHNAFGESLKNHDSGKSDRQNRGSGKARRRRKKSSDTGDDILIRLKKSRRTDADKDRVKDWDEITTFHHPADKTDTPPRDLVKQLKKHLRSRRNNGAGFEPVHAEK